MSEQSERMAQRPGAEDHERREQIADLVHRYSDAVVHRARDQWESCWAEDSLWDLGPDRL